MWNILVYTAAFAAAVSVIAAGLEHLAIRRGLPRRFVWLLALLCSTVVPPAIMLNSGVAAAPAAVAVERLSLTIESTPGPADMRTADAVKAWPVAAPVTPAPATGPGRLHAPSGRNLLLAWAAVSGTLLCLLIGAGIFLRHRAARWQRTSLRGVDLLVSDDTGPALLGVLRPEIVVPRWFLEEPAGTQALILAHEQQHVAARDPLLLRAAMLMTLVAPWNLPLWWQLRRLRIAIELDCDARVMRGGAAADRYGEVLLEVTQRAAAMPMGVIAMSEPVSALERRIRSLAPAPDRHAALRVIGAAVIAVAGVGAAIALEAPAIQSDSRAPQRAVVPAGATAAARPAQPAESAPRVSSAPAQTLRPASSPTVAAKSTPSSTREERVNGMDVRELIALAADKFHKRFVVDPRVRASVELIGFAPDSMTYHAFLEVLGVHGFAAVPSGDVVTIIPDGMARSVASPIVSADRIEGDDSEFVTVIIPVPANVDGTRLGMTLRQLVGTGGVLNPMSDEKSLLLVDKVANAKRIVALIRAQPNNQPADSRIVTTIIDVPPTISAAQLAAELRQHLSGKGLLLPVQDTNKLIVTDEANNAKRISALVQQYSRSR
jgi:beta-lactamase regulating signal transducer with metallopeptidase domain